MIPEQSKRVRPRTTPHVRLATLGQRVFHDLGDRVGRRRLDQRLVAGPLRLRRHAHLTGLGVLAGDLHDLVDVPPGPVVDEERPPHVLRRAVALEHLRRAEDGVGRVVDVGPAVSVAVGGVTVELRRDLDLCLAAPRADQKLHRPGGAGVVGAALHAGQRGAAVVGLPLADGGQHVPLHADLLAVLAVELQVLVGDVGGGRSGRCPRPGRRRPRSRPSAAADEGREAAHHQHRRHDTDQAERRHASTSTRRTAASTYDSAVHPSRGPRGLVVSLLAGVRRLQVVDPPVGADLDDRDGVLLDQFASSPLLAVTLLGAGRPRRPPRRCRSAGSPSPAPSPTETTWSARFASTVPGEVTRAWQHARRTRPWCNRFSRLP